MCLTVFFLCSARVNNTVFFFFSSRRRHTRLTCDWSSDVCSSDLGRGEAGCGGRPRHQGGQARGNTTSSRHEDSSAAGSAGYGGTTGRTTTVCGIVAYIGSRDSVPILLEGLARLEYRGY